jgi:hypothetical protein
VLAIHELDLVFAALDRRIRVKRGRLLSLDDVTDNNLVFVGSPLENLTLRDISTTSHFRFGPITDPSGRKSYGVRNLRLAPGEQPVYVRAPGRPSIDDYCIIALIPAIRPPHWVLLLAGTTTMGTQAAVEYVCRASTLATLMQRLGRAGAAKPFEAMLHANVKRGVPVDSEIVAIRAEH